MFQVIELKISLFPKIKKKEVLITLINTIDFGFDQMMIVEFSNTRTKARVCQGVVNRKKLLQLKVLAKHHKLGEFVVY